MVAAGGAVSNAADAAGGGYVVALVPKGAPEGGEEARNDGHGGEVPGRTPVRGEALLRGGDAAVTGAAIQMDSVVTNAKQKP